MSNSITIELSAEDRARIDKLTSVLEKVLLLKASEMARKKAIAESPAGASGEATEAAEATTPTNTKAEEENPRNEAVEPTAKEEAAPRDPIESFAQHSSKAETVKPSVTLEQIQQKVVQLAAGFGGTKKAKVREVINAYAKKVSDLPEDKWTEVWDKLTSLEKED